MPYGDSTTPEIERIASAIVDSIYRVYEELGPGLLESAYEKCLAYELSGRGFDVLNQVLLPIRYRGEEIDEGFRIDLLVNGLVVIEVKAVQKLMPIHEAQLLTYLKLSNRRLGILVNFNADYLKDQLKRIVR